MRVEIADPAKERRIERGRKLEFASHPAEQIAIHGLQQRLEIVKLGFAETRELSFGEAAEDKVHLLHAPVPGAVENAAAAVIEGRPVQF